MKDHDPIISLLHALDALRQVGNPLSRRCPYAPPARVGDATLQACVDVAEASEIKSVKVLADLADQWLPIV